jgi:glycosyltransferase involved in cell wall biosynthesis
MEYMDILVSIITPNYNSADFIEQTIESVLAQTYQRWEMIIVDDCSTDGSYNIALGCAEKDNRIKVYRMEKNSGAALTRNKAIEYSNGDYLAFLDSDDVWYPEKIERQVKFMIENECDFSFTEYEHIVGDKNAPVVIAKIIKKLTYRKMLFHCFSGCSTVIYKQDLSKKIYGPPLENCDDYGLFLQVLRYMNNARGYPECLTKYRIRQGSLSRNKIKKIKSYFDLMINCEHINIIFVFLYLCTNQLIKIIWKYKISSSKNVRIKEGRKPDKEVSIKTYLDVILQVNSAMFRKVLKISNSTRGIEKVIEEAGLAVKYEARGEEKARSEIARNLLGIGWTAEQTAQISRLSIEKVKVFCQVIHNC